MYDPIRRAACWLWLLLAPGRGRHRVGGGTVDREVGARTSPGRRAGAVAAAVPLPRHRSPYGRDDVPFDGGVTRLVRPYLVVHEDEQERARQWRRRLALVLAADFGIDLDRHLVGAEVGC
ncbi:hypothetical protein GL263_11460 [Streptomyces durbertensis]|uniref:Secreted protein n=1 Tax=Streptomyces durbertensis TaxID=2448886 RepID=A0ABR6EI21_9ACTN|nr:hypothetical protein [Streptomyces durbertensis]MBB1244169.1 hypothetical protein [Streptomyces durbertensis]